MRATFAVFYLLCSFNSFSQLKPYQATIKDINSVKYFRIKSKDVAIDTNYHKAFFNKIEVEDLRFDTTNIGIWAGPQLGVFNFGNVVENKKINFENSLSSFLKNYLDKIYLTESTKSDTGLVCFIKQFNSNKRDTFNQSMRHDENYGELKVEIECYYRIGTSYYPAVRIDTVFINTLRVAKRELVESFGTILISDFLNLLTNKIDNINVSRIIKRKVYQKNELYSKYKKRFDLPILTTSSYTKGVYTNFSEFKNNNPSIKNFKVKREEFRTYSLSDTSGNIITATKIFGYCDGQKIWIQMGNLSFPLLKVGNSFEFFASINKNFKILVQINMDEGKPY